MTTRFKAITVALYSDVREDDAKKLMEAIMCMNGVIAVTGEAVKPEDFVARQRANRQMRMTLENMITKTYMMDNL